MDVEGEKDRGGIRTKYLGYVIKKRGG